VGTWSRTVEQEGSCGNRFGVKKQVGLATSKGWGERRGRMTEMVNKEKNRIENAWRDRKERGGPD